MSSSVGSLDSCRPLPRMSGSASCSSLALILAASRARRSLPRLLERREVGRGADAEVRGGGCDRSGCGWGLLERGLGGLRTNSEPPQPMMVLGLMWRLTSAGFAIGLEMCCKEIINVAVVVVLDAREVIDVDDTAGLNWVTGPPRQQN